jgi:hypothetical protein
MTYGPKLCPGSTIRVVGRQLLDSLFVESAQNRLRDSPAFRDHSGQRAIFLIAVPSGKVIHDIVAGFQRSLGYTRGACLWVLSDLTKRLEIQLKSSTFGIDEDEISRDQRIILVHLVISMSFGSVALRLEDDAYSHQSPPRIQSWH